MEISEDLRHIDCNLQYITRRHQKPVCTVPPPPTLKEAPTVTIEDIISLVKPPYSVIRDKRGPMYDTTFIAIKCKNGHIHKYYHSDILRDRGVKCTTCNHHGKYLNTLRAVLESASGFPFMVGDSDEITCPKLQLTVTHAPGVETPTSKYEDGYIMIQLPKLHKRLILQTICHQLTLQSQHIGENIKPMFGKLTSAKIPSKYKAVKSPLPFTKCLASTVVKGIADSGDSFEQFNIAECEEMYIENCKYTV